MELRQFVAETLVQIQEGVQDAINRRSATPGSAGVINPVFGTVYSNDHRQLVEFDVAVTVSAKGGKSAKGKLQVFSIELGAEGSKTAEKNTVSRLKFMVPVVPPTTRVDPA